MRIKDPSFSHQHFTSLTLGRNINPAPWEKEALLQRQEHIYRQKQPERNDHVQDPLRPISSQSRRAKSPPKTFENQLAEAFLWLETHFPHYFGEERVVRPLNLSLLQEIKLFYSKGKNLFPPNLPLRAALKRYCVSDEYLETLIPGALRYDCIIRAKSISESGSNRSLIPV